VPRLLLLALLVPLAAACGGHSTSSSNGGPEVPHWTAVEQLPTKAVPGARVFVAEGCTACHTYAGSGHTNLEAPDLTAIGTRGLGIPFFIAHLKCPSCVNPGSPMPSFKSLGPLRLHQLAVFMEASKGAH
jgi:cbb3-type cytochrome oxidase cytochrome c subunit